MENNKVKFGLSNVKVWPITEEAESKVTYGTAIALKGAVNLSLKAKGNSDVFYADDIVYWQAYGSEGYEGDLEIALMPEEFEVEILGAQKDANGVLFEPNNPKTKKFAMAFEFKGDKKKTRHILYNCACSRPDIQAKTLSGKRDPQTDKLSITISGSEAYGCVKAKCVEGSAGYDKFYDKPYEKAIGA